MKNLYNYTGPEDDDTSGDDDWGDQDGSGD